MTERHSSELRRHARRAAALVLLAALLPAVAAPRKAASDKIARAISGTVQSGHGPEAGVWVIAHTNDLPTGFTRIVVTDDHGRFLVPDLPAAHYQVWVRGYGLVDSKKIEARPGAKLKLRAAIAPSEAAAAEYYPGVYWYSMLHIPPASDFPGTGPEGNGINPDIRNQDAWVDSIKNSCQSCHALGSMGVRHVPKLFASKGDSATAWAYRTSAGQAQVNMKLTLGWLGPERALKEFADWTDRIKAGELPFEKPARPVGVERNVVITEWDWSSNRYYMHDAISTDKRNPHINANGPVYGSPEESTDLVPVLDPKTNTASEIRHPYLDPNTPSSLDLPKGESAYWGMERIWDGHTSIHNPIMDSQGRVWFTARIRPAANPPQCKVGSDLESAKVTPQNESVRQLSMYDPKTQAWKLVDTCFTTQHLYFGHDSDDTLWTSAGSPASGVVGWLNTRKYLETGDGFASQGWTAIVADSNGNGRRDEIAAAGTSADAAHDTWVKAAFYGVQPSPIDDTIWGQSMGSGFSRIDQPSYIIRLIPGNDPPRTALSELFKPPAGAFGSRGVDVDSQGVAWTVLSSGQMARFDRRQCKTPMNQVIGGPDAVDGSACPEGWTLYRFPGPQFRGLDPKGSADHAYYIWVDRFNTLGLGRDVPIATANGGEALLALVDGKFVTLRVPYPLGFFSKNADGRIDDESAGWHGRGLWTTTGTRANFHGEGGRDARPKVIKMQIRPDPLAP